MTNQPQEHLFLVLYQEKLKYASCIVCMLSLFLVIVASYWIHAEFWLNISQLDTVCRNQKAVTRLTNGRNTFLTSYNRLVKQNITWASCDVGMLALFLQIMAYY